MEAKNTQHGITGAPPSEREENPQASQGAGTGYQKSKMLMGKTCEDIRQAKNLMTEILHDNDDTQAMIQEGLSALIEKSEEMKNCAQVWPHTMRNEIHNALARAVNPLMRSAERAGRELEETCRPILDALICMRKRAEEREASVKANLLQILNLAGVVYLIVHTW